VRDFAENSVRVSIATQKMHVFLDGVLAATYPISTSRFGLGFEEGSLRTPTGRFVVSEKIGDGAPMGTVFRGRIPSGEMAHEGGEEDRVLTRILWLDGIEPANANTKDRFIYIHGTNQEAQIGQPASHGCIRMRNKDIVELFDTIPAGTPVLVC
jgi:L,D-transpeptidase YbiS